MLPASLDAKNTHTQSELSILLEVLTPLVPQFFLPLASVANVGELLTGEWRVLADIRRSHEKLLFCTRRLWSTPMQSRTWSFTTCLHLPHPHRFIREYLFTKHSPQPLLKLPTSTLISVSHHCTYSFYRLLLGSTYLRYHIDRHLVPQGKLPSPNEIMVLHEEAIQFTEKFGRDFLSSLVAGGWQIEHLFWSAASSRVELTNVAQVGEYLFINNP